MRQRNARWLAGRKEKLEKEEEVSKKEKKKKEKLENQNKRKAKFDKEKKVWKEKKSSRIINGMCPYPNWQLLEKSKSQR